ncbi:MAG: GTP 3',8-cyclase MoaA [Rhodothermaceae bacterium]|nr:GTP 3',8-cyclase MoaA [Rhodothermaceae bacterium]
MGSRKGRPSYALPSFSVGHGWHRNRFGGVVSADAGRRDHPRPGDRGRGSVPAEAAMSALLTDRFERRHTYLRIGLTERCNLRCVYCMPAAGIPVQPKSAYLTADEIERLARLFVAEGVTKVRLTGGEPLVRKDAVAIAARIGAVPGVEALALTTNALLLEGRLPALKAAGLTHLNISLDTLYPDRFRTLTRRDGLHQVLSAIEAALTLGYGTPERPLKINAVVLRGVNDDELADFVAWTREVPLEVRFIEYMPFDGNGWADGELVPLAEMRASIEAVHGPLKALPGQPEDTATIFRVPGFAGTVGFIASMTVPFCAGCNRLRITADGSFKVCLFGPTEISLRDQMREGASDDDLHRLIGGAVRGKKAAHAGMDVLAATKNRPMITIGG